MKLYDMIRQAVELVPEVKAHLSDAALKLLRKRDKREPFRREKEETEDAIQMLFERRFLRQRRKLTRMLADYTGRKVAIPPIDTIFETDDDEDEFYARLVMLITKAIRTGIGITAVDIGIGMDWTLINQEAADFARKYAFDLVRKIDQTTRGILQNAVSMFVETPGMTLRDLADMLPFDEQRAFTVAVTETTRAFAEGQKLAAREIARQFPDVLVTKTWHTNNDDKVCDICGPLDGKEIPIDEEFDPSDPAAHPHCRCWLSTRTRIDGKIPK